MGLVYLELCCGTKSLGKVAALMGYRVTSVDSDPQHNATVCIDIMDWDYEQWQWFDHIHASPPCTTFGKRSHMTHRDATNAPLTPEAKRADALVARIIDIINHFRQINPNLTYTIENPQGPCTGPPAPPRGDAATAGTDHHLVQSIWRSTLQANVLVGEFPAAAAAHLDEAIPHSNEL